MVKESLIHELLEIHQDYLGPAAERFLERQIATHLRKSPASINRRDLVKLADWLKLSFALLTDDVKLIEEYAGRLELLAEGETDKALSTKRWQSD